MEKSSSRLQDVELLQGLTIVLRTDFWSGNARRMELAGHSLQLCMTSMRRSGWFAKRHESIVPSEEDSGPSLQQKWLQWREIESRKRLVFALFRHDANSSLTLSINR